MKNVLLDDILECAGFPAFFITSGPKSGHASNSGSVNSPTVLKSAIRPRRVPESSHAKFALERRDRRGLVLANVEHPFEIAEVENVAKFRPQIAEPQGCLAELYFAVQ